MTIAYRLSKNYTEHLFRSRTCDIWRELYKIIIYVLWLTSGLIPDFAKEFGLKKLVLGSILLPKASWLSLENRMGIEGSIWKMYLLLQRNLNRSVPSHQILYMIITHKLNTIKHDMNFTINKKNLIIMWCLIHYCFVFIQTTQAIERMETILTDRGREIGRVERAHVSF